MKQISLRPRLSRQLASYSLVGLGSNLLGYGAYLLLVANRLNPKLAITLLYFVGVLIGYLGNKHLTFRHTGSFLAIGVRYLVVYILGYLLNLFLIIWFVDRLGFPHQIVQALAILVVAVVLFIMLRTFVFEQHSSSGKS